MRHTLVVSAMVLVMSASASAQEWIEFASREDGFTCNFPGQPTIAETTFRSQFGADLPARVYSAKSGPGRYSMTVVDYRSIEKILTEKSKSCPAGAEACSGNTAPTSSTGAGYWKADVAGALIYATWQFMERDAKVTHFLWNNVDFVEGHQLQLTNAGQVPHPRRRSTCTKTSCTSWKAPCRKATQSLESFSSRWAGSMRTGSRFATGRCTTTDSPRPRVIAFFEIRSVRLQPDEQRSYRFR